jgi:hypothetical protein
VGSKKGAPVAKPLIVVSTFKVRDGAADALRGYYQRVAGIVEANEPRVIAFNGFLNEDATEMTSVQVHPDAASMDFHMEVLRDNWDESFGEYAELLEQVSIEYYGAPPASALEMDAGREGVRVKPRHIGGFTRGS